MEPSTSTPSVIRSDALPKGAHVEHPAVPGECIPFELTEKHAAAMAKIRAMGF